MSDPLFRLQMHNQPGTTKVSSLKGSKVRRRSLAWLAQFRTPFSRARPTPRERGFASSRNASALARVRCGAQARSSVGKSSQAKH